MATTTSSTILDPDVPWKPEHLDRDELLFQLAIVAQEDLDRGTPIGDYVKGKRDAYLMAVAFAVNGPETRGVAATTERLQQALENGTRNVQQLRDLASRVAGQISPTMVGFNWLGPKAFEAQHGHCGIDEDFGMRWGAKRDIHISFRRQPGADEGLLYAYDKTWDDYAVLAPTIHRDLVQQTYRHALAANPDMAPEDFARHLHTLTTTQPSTTARTRAVQL